MKVSLKVMGSVVVPLAAGAFFVAGCSNPDEEPFPEKNLGKHAKPPPPQQPQEMVARQDSISDAMGGKHDYKVIQAIFNQRCMPCHSADVHKDGVDLSSYDAVVAGKKGGEPLFGGQPQGSPLYMAVITNTPK